MMCTASAGINSFIILKLDAKKFDKCKHFCKQPEWFRWAHRRWPFYTYLRHVHVLDHGHYTDIVSTLII